MKRHERCRTSGRLLPACEIPLLSSFLYLLGEAKSEPCARTLSAKHRALRGLCDSTRGHCQAGSLTGAVHLSKSNAGVLRPAQRGQKPRVEQKGKSWLDLDFQYEYRPRKRGLSILLTWEHHSRGVRKVTTGITGLWRPSVHSDVAF